MNFTTKNGTELPLLNLKGKQYLMVAHRLVWLNEEVKNFTIETDLLQCTEDFTVARAKVTIFDETGLKVVKSSTATKRETKKDFSDHSEKAETGSIGRALALLGFGTAFALADLDEGMRLADAPLETVKKSAKLETGSSAAALATGLNVIEGGELVQPLVLPKEKVSSFRRDRQTTPVSTPTTTNAPTAAQKGWK